jgi:hypothetical protein
MVRFLFLPQIPRIVTVNQDTPLRYILPVELVGHLLLRIINAEVFFGNWEMGNTKNGNGIPIISISYEGKTTTPWLVINSTRCELVAQLVIRGPLVTNQIFMTSGTEDPKVYAELLSATILKVDPLKRINFGDVSGILTRTYFLGFGIRRRDGVCISKMSPQSEESRTAGRFRARGGEGGGLGSRGG